jgi:hypothetical protein
MARLQIYRKSNGGRIRWRISGWQHGGPDIAGYLADANVEGEMRVLALGDTHGVIQGCG